MMRRLRFRQAGLSKVVLLVSIVVVILLAAGTTGILFAMGVFGGKHDAATAEAEAPPPPKPPLYLPMDPPLVANIDRNGRMGFLQVNIQLMTRDPDVKAAIDTHMPVIRNNLLLLLGAQNYQEVMTVDGKQKLRAQAIEAINKVLEEQGVAGRVEDLYFTGFVMQ